MKRALPLLMAAISISTVGCWNDSDSNPQPLPTPAPSATSPRSTGCHDAIAVQAAHSGDVCTSSLLLDMSAQSYGNGTDVYVALHSSWSSNFLDLTGGDSLQAGTGSDTELTTLEPPDGTLHYTAHFDTSDPGEVSIFLNRIGDRLPGAVSNVTVAPAFAVTDSPASFTYGDSVRFTIDPPPAAGVVSVYASGACIASLGVDGETTIPVIDSSATVATKDLFVVDGEPCSVTFHVRVETSGTVSAALGGESIVGLQERAFQSALQL